MTKVKLIAYQNPKLFNKNEKNIFWLKDSALVYSIHIPMYRVSINSFPDYKHLLQENYVEYKYIYFFQNVTQLKKFFLQHISTLQHVLLFVFHVVSL